MTDLNILVWNNQRRLAFIENHYVYESQVINPICYQLSVDCCSAGRGEVVDLRATRKSSFFWGWTRKFTGHT